jgi:hypothetical protein
MQHAHLLSRKQTFGPQPVIATLQIKGPPDMTNFLEVEWCVLPSLSTLLVQNLGHFAIAVLIQELIDLGDDLRLGLCLSLFDCTHDVMAARDRPIDFSDITPSPAAFSPTGAPKPTQIHLKQSNTRPSHTGCLERMPFSAARYSF